MIWSILCVAIYAHMGDTTPIAKVCSDAPIAMSDAFIIAECKDYFAHDIIRSINRKVETLEITLEE